MKNHLTRCVFVLGILVLVSCASGTKKGGGPDASEGTKSQNTDGTPRVPELKAANPAEPHDTTCKKGSEERKIELVKSGAGCELHYTKSGKEETIATAHKGTQHCEEIFERIHGRLKAAGYKCE